MKNFASWWKARNTREQLILGIGAVLLLMLFYYSFVLSPLDEGVGRLHQQLSNEQELAGWLVSVAPEVQRLRGSQPSGGNRKGGSLLSVVDQTAKAAGLAKSVSRLQPEGEKEVRAWLEAAPFSETLRWLRTLESSYGVEIAEFSFNRANESGLVKARITFKRS